MAMHWTLGCDAADPQGLASFWSLALGYVKEPGFDERDNASIIDPEGQRPAIGFLRVPEGKTAKNRVHVDIRVAGDGPWDMAERERLISRQDRSSARWLGVLSASDQGSRAWPASTRPRCRVVECATLTSASVSGTIGLGGVTCTYC